MSTLGHTLAGAHATSPNPAAATTAPQTAGTQPVVDFSQDPLLQQIEAFNKRKVDQAAANELAGRKQALIAYGYDPSLDSLYPDEATKQAAKDNPFSTVAQLAHNYQQRTQNLEEGLNKSNLFYSSYRGNKLGENAREYQGEQAGAVGGLNEKLSGLAATLAGIRDEAAQGNLNAEGEAYGRYKPPDTMPTTLGGGAPTMSSIPTTLLNRAPTMRPGSAATSFSVRPRRLTNRLSGFHGLLTP